MTGTSPAELRPIIVSITNNNFGKLFARFTYMQFTGTLKTWHDDRGFGFIEPTSGGQEIFVHIKAFPLGTGRPSVGQQLVFEVGTGKNGKKSAHSVQYPPRSRAGSQTRIESSAEWTFLRALVIPFFIGVYALSAWRWGSAPVVLFAYSALTIVTFLLYAIDKSAAIAGRWRTPENTLHLLSLVGGWPGALLAQQLLRHKTSKGRFVAMFWVTVVLNICGLVAWHAGLLPVPRP